MWLDRGWGPRASEEILRRTSRGAASLSPPGHAGSASSLPLGARRPTGDLWGRRAWEPRPRPHLAPLGLRRALELTSPKFRAPARWPRGVRPRVRRAGGKGGPLFPGFSGQNPAGAAAKVLEEGF